MKVWVELDLDGKVFRLLPHKQSTGSSRCVEMDKAEAIAAIRYQVFRNSGHKCRDCGNPITWNTMHMHEVIHRGKGGKMGVDNSVALCSECHLNIEHGNRKPQWTKVKDRK